MKPKALRLPEDLLVTVKYAEKKERLDEPTTLRKFLRLGAEKYMADCYSRGEISLREAAEILSVPTREALEMFWDLGVTGNVGAEEAMLAISRVKRRQSA